MCIHALHMNASYIACVRVFLNAIHILVCCCIGVIVNNDSDLVRNAQKIILNAVVYAVNTIRIGRDNNGEIFLNTKGKNIIYTCNF